MFCAPLQTWLFYGSVFGIELGIAYFLGKILYEGTRNVPEAEQWRWSSEDSRDMWIDVVKTMISASGIAAALLAALTLGSPAGTVRPLVAHSVKSATVLLVICVCVSMVAILILARGHETAKSRNLERLRRQDQPTTGVTGGLLEISTFCFLLLAGFISLSGFFVGFLFLARIVWHI